MRRFTALLFAVCAVCFHTVAAGGGPVSVGPLEFDSPATVNQPVNFSIAVSGVDDPEFRVRIDGVVVLTSPDPDFQHTFTAPGGYHISVQVRDGGSVIATRTGRIVIEPVSGAFLPTRSTSIAIHEATRAVWVVNPDHGSVARLDANTLKREFVTSKICSDPQSVALDNMGRPWVACRGDDRLLRLNFGGAVEAMLELDYGAAPQAVAFTPDGMTGFASLGGKGEVIRFDPGLAQITGSVDAGPDPHALAVTAAGDRLFVSRLISGSHDEHGSILEIDLISFDGYTKIELPLDGTTDPSGTAGPGLPNYVAALAIAPDDSRLWYSAKKDNIVHGQFHQGTDLTFDSTVRVMTGALDLVTGEELLGQRRDLDDSSMALAIAPSPGGAHLFVALAGNNRILARGAWQNQQPDRLDVGFAPRGLIVDSQTQQLWVRNDLDRSVSVIDAADVLNDDLPGLQEIAVISTVEDEVLEPEVLSGKRVFSNAEDTRMALDGYLNCATCHLDGGGDGRVWDFTQQGEGLRATIPLNGRGGMAHGPLHWSANFDEVQDFEVQIRSLFAGSGFIDNNDFQSDTLGPPMAGLSQELDDLAAYLSSLDNFGRSPHRATDGSLTADGEAGRQIFETLLCHRCHGGANYTDSGYGVMHDVGTLAEHSGGRLGGPLPGLDTPTLRGLWKRAPYLHDGSAPTVEAVLAGMDVQHADLGELDETGIAQLAAFLLQIDDAEPAAPEDRVFIDRFEAD